MNNFDHVRVLQADEQTQRQMIAEVVQEKKECPRNADMSLDCCSCRYDASNNAMISCPIPGPVTEPFEVLAFRLRDKVDNEEYTLALMGILDKKRMYDIVGRATPLEMICAALMAWPEKESK